MYIAGICTETRACFDIAASNQAECGRKLDHGRELSSGKEAALTAVEVHTDGSQKEASFSPYQPF